MTRALPLALALACACGHRDRSSTTTTLVVRVTDAGKPIAARVLLRDAKGQPLHLGSIDLWGARQGAAACAIAPGVVASWDGLVLAYGSGEFAVGDGACRIPSGRYTVWAWRGVEYERWEGEVDLSADRGRVDLAIALERAWQPHGALAADLHVHAQASGDSKMPNPQRVTTQVAAGIQVIGLSDHDTNGDLADDIHALHLDDTVVSIASNELTAEQLHVGVYPVIVERDKPAGGSPDNDALHALSAAQMFALAHALPGHPFVQLNHPRMRFNALYDGMKWDGVAWPPPFPIAFDGVEVLAGYSAFNIAGGERRFDEGTRDFYTLVDHGHLVTPLGNSDTHDFNWVLDGTARNYVFVDDARVHPFDQDAFVAALRARRVVATTGPWLDVEVAPSKGRPTVGPGESVVPNGGGVWLDVTVSRARWVKVDRIRVTVGTRNGPTLVKTIDVPPDTRAYSWHGAIEVGSSDTWIGITADGDTPLPLELTGTYQRDKWQRPGVTPFAIASPILVDVDGDGRWKRGDADMKLR